MKQIQEAAVQAVALYGADIWWNSQKGLGEEHQKLINKQGRAVAEIMRSAPVVSVTREAGLWARLSLLNN